MSKIININGQQVVNTNEVKVDDHGVRGKHHKFTFTNGYVVSVVLSLDEGQRYDGYYTNGPDTFELAILLPNDDIAYETGISITYDGKKECIDYNVCGCISRDQVNEVLRAVTEL